MGHKREVRTETQEDKYNTVKTSKGEQGAAHRAMEVSFLFYSPMSHLSLPLTLCQDIPGGEENKRDAALLIDRTITANTHPDGETDISK